MKTIKPWVKCLTSKQLLQMSTSHDFHNYIRENRDDILKEIKRRQKRHSAKSPL